MYIRHLHEHVDISYARTDQDTLHTHTHIAHTYTQSLSHTQDSSVDDAHAAHGQHGGQHGDFPLSAVERGGKLDAQARVERVL